MDQNSHWTRFLILGYCMVALMAPTVIAGVFTFSIRVSIFPALSRQLQERWASWLVLRFQQRAFGASI